MATRQPSFFRAEALDHFNREQPVDGDVLRLSPHWIRWTFPLVVACALAGLVLVCVLNINQYASGPAVIRAADRTDLTLTVTGIVASVDVVSGQSVAAGDTLVRLEASSQRSELAELDREFERQMTDLLRVPTDAAARLSVAALHLRREAAQRDLAAYVIRAPHAGVVRDLRTRPGQQLAPGQVAVTLIAASPELTLVALLPGHFRPQLSDSLVARFEPAGYTHTHQSIDLVTINDEVIGPNEARRYLGAGVADAVAINGPVVVVEALLASTGFRDGDRTLSFHDGMQGRLEVRLDSQPVIVSLLPILRNVGQARHD